MVELFANNGDPDQIPLSAASDPGLHCLPITLLGVSRLQWVIDDLLFNKKIVMYCLCLILCPKQRGVHNRFEGPFPIGELVSV